MKEILSINIRITEVCEIKCGEEEVSMIHFTGAADGPAFYGKVLPGAVDTQMKRKNCKRTLSARYCLEGRDYENHPCRIFIENNAATDETDPAGAILTKPVILTDSPALEWLNRAELEGKVLPAPDGVVIKIYAAEKEERHFS